jgi:hypothetical protein
MVDFSGPAAGLVGHSPAIDVLKNNIIVTALHMPTSLI